jgi:hypothetical protein
MKRTLWTVVALVVSMGLLSACQKKTEEVAPPADQPPAVAEPVKAPEPAPAPTGDDKATAEAMAKAMAEGSKGVDTSDAPEYVVKMIAHVKKINELVKDNMADCDKTVTVLTKYMEENKADLEGIKKAGEEADKTATPEQKQKVAGQMMALMGPIMQDMIGVQMQFQQKCQAQAAKLSEIMKGSMGK